jgi:hypothetical protein
MNAAGPAGRETQADRRTNLTRHQHESVLRLGANANESDPRAAWEQIKVHLFSYSGFTGRNLMRSSTAPWGCSKNSRQGSPGTHRQ